LPEIEDLVDAVKRLTDFGSDTSVEIVQRPELRSLRFVLTGRLRKPAELLQHPAALHLTATTNLLERPDAREKSRKLIVAQLEFFLRLHHDIRVEEPLDLLRIGCFAQC